MSVLPVVIVSQGRHLEAGGHETEGAEAWARWHRLREREFADGSARERLRRESLVKCEV